MGREAWLYRIGRFLCYFAAGAAIWIDTSLSYGWLFAMVENANLTKLLSFSLSVVTSSMGGVFCAPWALRFAFERPRQIARIDDPFQRLSELLGTAILALFLGGSIIATYWISLISTADYLKPRTTDFNAYALSILIVLLSDLCFVLARFCKRQALATAAAEDDFEATMGGRRKAPQTVNVNGRFE
ncbi:hypothetical protein H6F93_00575 [Leptolyngbya sp. FACHB-671]|uniref:hypothetical protein n=1 Tax=Leptolyngbya sp. FACHB-671 TaxID=2692812 RepID=UPI0016878083|nr:hypothetical protein [Leptolyngbya sp. FACHB-671]MBD2066045.1 hypothetical protein [Leptolyngbya sp. FACHB-671]